MTRWYKAFRCAGIQPEVLIDKIKFQVQKHELANIIPVVRVEKLRHRKHQRREYYLFLGIESPFPDQIPESVHSILQSVPALSCTINGSLTLEQIKSMVNRDEYDLESYDNVHLIPYKPPQVQPDSDPFEREDDSVVALNTDEHLIRSRRYDRLLLWLSAVGRGNWRLFQNACHELELVDQRTSPVTILRRLRLCGHMEISPDRNTWSVAPSVLVQREDFEDEHTYFLCGARDNRLVQWLREPASVTEYMQENGLAPALIALRINDSERMKAAFPDYRLHIAGSVAYRLAQRLPSLAGWVDTLEELQGILPHQFFLRKFTGSSFEEVPFDNTVSGMYELWHDEPPATLAQQPLARPHARLFYDAQKQRWLRGDWYGLRFLARQINQHPCPIHYESSSWHLAIPQDWHWPELYERVLVLASGKLPRYDDKGWYIYEAISQRLLDELTPRLNLKLIGDDYA